jgi:hypothetical protein
MAAIQTIVFERIPPDGLALIEAADWERFAAGGAPLVPGKRKIDLLLLTLREGVCEEADPITLDLDDNGYLVRIDVRMQPLPQHPSVLDARSAFIGRYLKHSHQWRPSERLIRRALDIISSIRRPNIVLT